jgi:hypothetical protein
MTHRVHNVTKINNYWSNFEKTRQHKSTAICYRAVLGRTIENKIISFKNTMYTKMSDERKERLIDITELLWHDEIDFIFENRRVIRMDENTSLTRKELFRWMKNIDETKYIQFKRTIHNSLKIIANSGSLTEDKIKKYIASEISSFLQDEFIRL